MPITINGTGTVTGISAGGLPDGVITRPEMGYAGAILQVVQGSTSTATTISSTTFADTSLSASITPSSSSSKILVFVDQVFRLSRNANDQYGGVRLLRGSTVIHSPVADVNGPYDTGAGYTGSTAANWYSRQSIIYLDSPNTTSSTTYKTQGAVYYTTNSGSSIFQPGGATTNSTSYITLLEVAA